MNSDHFCYQKPFVLIALFFIVINVDTAQADASAELTMAQLTEWLDAYGEAWESRDPDKAAGLFAENSSYQVTPYEEAHMGQAGVHQYWAGVTANQTNIKFEYRPLSITDNMGIAHWSAQFDVPGDIHLELNGIFILEFDEDGKCTKLREWWHLKTHDAEGETN